MGGLLGPDEVLRRQALYRFCAASLLYPEPERVETLRLGAAWLAEHLGEAWAELAPVLEATGAARDLTVLQGEWVRLFGVSRTSYCYPYEGAYLEPGQAPLLMVALQREYAEQGLTLQTDDLPDHVAVELEYMSFLYSRELEAIEDQDARQRLARAQRRFLDQHLCRWLPKLAQRVEAADGGIFAQVVAAADRITADERARLAR